MSHESLVVTTPDGLTVPWLARQLHTPDLVSFTSQVVGTGQTGLAYRLDLKYSNPHSAPATLILKVSAVDASSRASGVAYGLYEREVLFYNEIATGYHSPPLAKCYYGSFDAKSGTFALLLADAGPAIVGSDVDGATYEQAKHAAKALGELHGPLLRDPSKVPPWVAESKMNIPQAALQQLFNVYVTRYREKLTLGELDICARFVGSYDDFAALVAQKCMLGLIHGDYRLDNMLFGEEGADRPLTVVDWQTLRIGPVLGDLAYFLGSSIRAEDRRKWYDELLSIYVEALGPGTPLTREKCEHDMKYQAFFGVMMGIGSPILVGQTERGDAMFMAMMKRQCQLVLDLGSLDILPPPQKLIPLEPAADDEVMHPASHEPYYSESWYFDFCDPEQNIGCWVRLGVTPNQPGSWYTAIISRPRKPIVSVINYESPHPTDLVVKTDEFLATHSVVQPLKEFRVTLKGQGQLLAEEAALIRGEVGSPAKVTLDLNFSTDGTPYKYRVTTRYEIPCLVSGTVTIDDQTYTIKQQVGQRDHSWGVRDWWNMEWCWGTIHCKDLRIHFIDLKVLGSDAQIMIGYVQGPQIETKEFARVKTDPTYGDDDLVRHMELSCTTFSEETTTAVFQPISHGPVRLVASDGRVSLFDRAWCKATLDDGRVGYGWTEWNRVVVR